MEKYPAQAISLMHQASEAKMSCSKIASAAWILIVVSSSQPQLRLHLSGRTFAELIQAVVREKSKEGRPLLNHIMIR